MIERERAFQALAEHITDELVVTGIASQTASWFQVKHRPENLYLRGPMGLAPAVGLGIALAHPERKVVVIEGDGSLLMGLSSLVAIAHARPKNYMLICIDNGIYEAGGKGATVNAGKTDFVKTVEGVGFSIAKSVDKVEALEEEVQMLLRTWECSFLHVHVGLRKGPLNQPQLRPFEMKHQFLSALKNVGKTGFFCFVLFLVTTIIAHGG